MEASLDITRFVSPTGTAYRMRLSAIPRNPIRVFAPAALSGRPQGRPPQPQPRLGWQARA